MSAADAVCNFQFSDDLVKTVKINDTAIELRNSSNGILKNALIGALIGIVVGIVVAVIGKIVSNKRKDTEEVRTQEGAYDVGEKEPGATEKDGDDFFIIAGGEDEEAADFFSIERVIDTEDIDSEDTDTEDTDDEDADTEVIDFEGESEDVKAE